MNQKISTKKTTKREPNSNCADPAKYMQTGYAQQFLSNEKQAEEVYLQYASYVDLVLVSATHPQNCSPKGCVTSVFLTSSRLPCPKLVINHNGTLRMRGTAQKPYQIIEIIEKRDAVDGDTGPRLLKFDSTQLMYTEQKN